MRPRGPHGRRWSAEEGFTLVELLVVMVVIALLIAIALPAFISSRQRAQDGAAQALTRQALSVQIVFYGGAQRFSEDNSDGGELASLEPSITWGTLDATQRGVVASLAGTDQAAILRSLSATSRVYCIGRIEAGVNAGTYFAIDCDGTEDAAVIASWGSSPSLGW